jgi:hypothetical protein
LLEELVRLDLNDVGGVGPRVLRIVHDDRHARAGAVQPPQLLVAEVRVTPARATRRRQR